MKKTLLLVCACAVLFAVAILCTACSDKVRYIALNRGSLNDETWLEVEKNENIKICIDSKVRSWETSLDKEILGESCLKVRVPMLIGASTINVKFTDSSPSRKINLAIGMKYLDFKNEEVLLGFGYVNGSTDEKRPARITGTFLVDKYPVTNCEFLQLMWDEIPLESNNEMVKNWIERKKLSVRNEGCDAHDSATNIVYLYQALKYANTRSIREGLKPYYTFSKPIFSKNEYVRNKIISEGQYIISYHDFTSHDEERIKVSVDSSSDGYRLLYYDEWMMLARGGDKKNNAPWGDSATFKDVQKYAKIDNEKNYYAEKNYLNTSLVGQLRPNEYGLYDMFGLVEELVLLEHPKKFRRPHILIHPNGNRQKFKKSTIGCKTDCPSYLKGGGFYDNWQNISYGYYSYGGIGGFRLIRNIGNNAKWIEVKSDKK